MISPHQLPLVAHLIAAGAPQFLSDLDSLKLEPMDDGGMGSHQFQSPELDRRMGSMAAQCGFTDSDGIPVFASLLLDQNGQLFELELWKADFSPLRNWPKAVDLRIPKETEQIPALKHSSPPFQIPTSFVRSSEES